MPAKVTFSPVDVAESATDDTVVGNTVVENTAVEDSAIAGSAVADSAVADTVAADSAVEDTAVDDKAVDDTAVDDTAVDEPAPESAAEPVAVDEPASIAARPSWRPSNWTMLVAGLSVLLVALWVAGGFLVVHNRGVSQLATQRQEVLTAAQKVAGDLTSISADNAPAQIQALTGESTGAFRDQISTYAQALQTILQQSRAGSRGTVSAAGIEEMGPDTAKVLVTVSATVSNSQAAAQPVSYRLGVQLQREGDRWLASDVAFVQ